MRRFQLFLISAAVVAAASASVTACSGDDNNTDAGSDAAQDVFKKDVNNTNDAGGDAAPIVTPAGTELASSDGVQIFGVTTDNLVIYADASASNALFAVSAAGGSAPVKIATPASYAVGIAGKVVFVWSGLTAKGVGTLATWVSGGTLTTINAKSVPNAGFGATVDGKHILFSSTTDVNAATGDFLGANVDGTGQGPLVTGVDIGNTNACTPIVGFASNTYAVTATCTVTPPDGGTPSATVSTYAIDGGTTWTAVQLVTGGSNFWSTDTAGDKVMVATPIGISVYPIGGGVPTVIDTKNIENGNWTFGSMEPDGNNVIYTTAAGDFYITPTGAVPVPAQIQATGVKFMRAISADQAYALYTTNFDSQQFGGDLFLTKATAPGGTPITLVSATTGALFGTRAADDFTADSKFVLWIENLNTSLGIGDLYSLPVTGGTPKQVATGEWQNSSATGTKVIFNDNCAGCSGTGGTGVAFADLKVVDVAGTAAPTTLQAGADVPLVAGGNSIVLSAAKDRVVYTYSQNALTTGTAPPNGGNGLYSITIP